MNLASLETRRSWRGRVRQLGFAVVLSPCREVVEEAGSTVAAKGEGLSGVEERETDFGEREKSFGVFFILFYFKIIIIIYF